MVLPRSFIAGNFEVLAKVEAILSRFFSPDFNPATTVLLEEKPPLSPTPVVAATADILAYSPNKVLIRATSDKPALLFLSDSYFPGWQARVNNRDEKIYRANYTFRAVVVPAGNSTVEFTYDPRSFKAGLIISLLSAGVVLVLIFKKR